MFKKYQSIKRATDVNTLHYYVTHGYNNIKWYATEKVHGCNFSFITDGNEVKYAQRSMITDSIFNSHLDVHKVENQIKELALHLGKTIQVYGEYYGSNIAGKSSIPYFKENKKEFIFFDIRLVEENVFLEYPLNFELFDKFNIPRVPVLKEGTLEECLELSKSFDSIIAEIKTHAEGYVLKPFVPTNIDHSGDRVILKMIAPEFDDVKKSDTDLRIAKDKQENYDNYLFTKTVIDEKVNSIRCDKVAAKFGISSEEPQKFGLLVTEFLKDILEETEETVSEKLIKISLIPIVKQFFNIQ